MKMGISSSKIEDDKALILCRERKRFVRQALDGRCSLAAAHVSYIQSLKNTGTALRKFVEPEAAVESSLYTSTSATPEPLALTDKSLSQFSYSSPSMSQHVETMETGSPTASPPYSGQFQTNHMRTGGPSSATFEERPPTSVTATVQSSSVTPQSHTPRSVETPSFELPASPSRGTPPWDYFGLFHPIDNQLSFQDGQGSNHGLDNADYIRRLREEEDVPDLEEEGERVAFIEKPGHSESDEDSDEHTLLQRSEKQSKRMDSYSPNSSPILPTIKSLSQKIEQPNGEKKIHVDESGEAETPDMTSSMITPSIVIVPAEEKNETEKTSLVNNLVPKDFVSSIKEIEDLFLRASESGNEVPRMLEANKLHYRPIISQTKGIEQVPQETVTNETKYLPWHRSVSSCSSSSQNLLGANSKDSILEGSESTYCSIYMNSGSHASTLDRLYAWERKLYDEVKASGVIRREYDMKCKLLRQQESREENPIKIDKTRAIVKDLHSRIIVAIHRINTISKQIEELRDKELQPQLEELIEGLSRMWGMMLKTHKLQFDIISVAYNNGSLKVSVITESHPQATAQLEFELSCLCSSFTKWIDAQKAYVEAINKWLLKCVVPLQRRSSRKRRVEFSPTKDFAPPIFVTCRDWLVKLNEMATKDVADVAGSIKDVIRVTAQFMPRQDKKLHGKNLSLAFSWKGSGDGNLPDMSRNDAPSVDWNSSLQDLQSCLVKFFSHLKGFADLSVKNYDDLRKSIQYMKDVYEMNKPKKQTNQQSD
ncbi:hypothetical protein ACLOJK_024941 [Asimina triloba]